MKRLQDFRIVSNRSVADGFTLMVLTPQKEGDNIPEIQPGQFVEVKTGAVDVLLRRPISINKVDYEKQELWLLIRNAGKGTARLVGMKAGEMLNLMLPLGNGFSLPSPSAPKSTRLLLVGGGVGVAPLLQLGIALKKHGFSPEFLLAARNASMLLLLEEFEKVGKVHISTDDGSMGHQGLVTGNPILNEKIDFIYCCGPNPMMKGIAAISYEKGIGCEVSFENMMACGLGACLCCVEKTNKGNVCVCTEGPVFNINQLTWQTK